MGVEVAVPVAVALGVTVSVPVGDGVPVGVLVVGIQSIDVNASYVSGQGSTFPAISRARTRK